MLPSAGKLRVHNTYVTWHSGFLYRRGRACPGGSRQPLDKAIMTAAEGEHAQGQDRLWNTPTFLQIRFSGTKLKGKKSAFHRILG